MEKIKSWLLRFFYGRRGMDEMGIATYVTGLVLYFVSLFTRLGILYYLSLALWVYGIFRMLSKNLTKRAQENAWFLKWFTPIKKKFSQARVRFKNRKIYKYYRCPKCKSWLRLPRGIGEKTVTCGHCGASFQKKA